MPYRECVCQECDAQFEIYTHPEDDVDRLICPNCASGKVDVISFTSDVDIEQIKNIQKEIRGNKTRH